MTTYLIDYENTSFHGLEGFKKLAPQDTVVVFLGAKNGNSTMPVEVVRELTWLGERPLLLWKRSKKTSKNYLDLQLVSYLGSLIGDSEIKETEYVIVSNDRDFDAAVDFWAERRRDVSILLRNTIAQEPQQTSVEETPPTLPRPKSASPATASESTKRAVRVSVKPLALKPSDYSGIYRAFAVSSNAQELHVNLAKEVKGQGQSIYPLVKEIYLQHRESLNER